MITIDTDPEANPIYIGALIIKGFDSFVMNKIDVTELYEYIEGKIQISFDLFLYALDWLYIIGAIYLDINGDVVYAPK